MKGNLLVIDKKIRTVRKELSPSPIINIDVKKLQSWKSKHQQLKQNSIKTKSKGRLQSTTLDRELDNVRFVNHYLLFNSPLYSLTKHSSKSLFKSVERLLKGTIRNKSLIHHHSTLNSQDSSHVSRNNF